MAALELEGVFIIVEENASNSIKRESNEMSKVDENGSEPNSMGDNLIVLPCSN